MHFKLNSGYNIIIYVTFTLLSWQLQISKKLNSQLLANTEDTMFGMHQLHVCILVYFVDLKYTSLEFESIEDEHWNTLIFECASLSAEWEKVSGYPGLSFKLIDTENQAGSSK